jgi:hypothetical protein
MNALSEAEWRTTFERAGFTQVETQRVHDRRGPGEPAAFESDQCIADHEAKKALHAAGSLWIHARKP